MGGKADFPCKEDDCAILQAALWAQGWQWVWPPSLPHTVPLAQFQPGLGLEIQLCLLHYAFAQGSLSGEAH